MADFVQTMKDWQRMCNASKSCNDCPMHKEDGWAYVLCSEGGIASARPEVAEKVIVKWAVEHPVVYPTWFEVLERFGVVGSINGEPYYDSMDREIYLKQPAFTAKAFDPIPADIAEKLGIEPKEEER